MDIKTTCKNCKSEFKLQSSFQSRHELENKKGRYFFEQCPKCQSTNEYHVNDFYAEKDGLGLLMLKVFSGSLVIFIIMIFLGVGLISIFALAAPIIIYIGVKRSVEHNLNLFNAHRISRTRN